MTSLTIVLDAETPWRESTSPQWAGKVAPGEPDLRYKLLMERKPGLPNLQRVMYDPDHFEPPHSHAEDEVIYLIEGEVALGSKRLGPGDVLFIPRDTRYSLKAGSAGTHFIRVGLPT